MSIIRYPCVNELRFDRNCYLSEKLNIASILSDCSWCIWNAFLKKLICVEESDENGGCDPEGKAGRNAGAFILLVKKSINACWARVIRLMGYKKKGSSTAALKLTPKHTSNTERIAFQTY